MKLLILALSLAMAAAACAAPHSTEVAAVSAYRATDGQQIRDLQQAQADAWNAHDIAAYSALFSEDAQVVNVLGWHWHSRAELEQKLGLGFRWVFAESTLMIGDVEVRFLSDDLAVAHVRWTMNGARSPTGTVTHIPQNGIQTQVLQRQEGRWRIISFQNTNSIPERDFPVGAP